MNDEHCPKCGASSYSHGSRGNETLQRIFFICGTDTLEDGVTLCKQSDRCRARELEAENARLREGVEGLAKWLHTRAYMYNDCYGATHCELLVAETRVRHLLVDTAALAGKEAT